MAKVIKKQYGPGSFGCHEALYVASLLADMVDNHLCSHPAIEANKEWQLRAVAAREMLFSLYQDIGEKHL